MCGDYVHSGLIAIRVSRYNPACAGTTQSARRAAPHPTIQPRVCGDYISRVSFSSRKSDTTPRVRGLRDLPHIHSRQSRYNPACAGTTLRISSRIDFKSIQPRVCGDYKTVGIKCCATADTTPRVRGLPLYAEHIDIANRYNPACAGTTCHDGRLRHQLAIQPRVCGDYMSTPSKVQRSIDTTPRVRGLHIVEKVDDRVRRYNPACAGTTHGPTIQRAGAAIQPRVCGDYQSPSCHAVCMSDTTPRVRGLLSVVEVILNSYRYNPACAGTTLSILYYHRMRTIQPRVCGDYIIDSGKVGHIRDTTPRVRGLQVK